MIMATPAKQTPTTAQIEDALCLRYPKESHALIFGVRDKAGFAANRTGDAVAVGLWPSRGLEIEGFEIKASRSDWLRELKDHAKAEALFQFCDRWWIATGDASIAQAHEIPPKWGLLVYSGGRLRVSIQAEKLEPKQITRSFLASLMKRVMAQAPSEEQLRRVREEAAREANNSCKHMVERSKESLRLLQKIVYDFEAASGVRIESWQDGKKIGEAVKLVLSGNHIPRIDAVKRYRAELANSLEFIDKALQHVGSNRLPEKDEDTGEEVA